MGGFRSCHGELRQRVLGLVTSGTSVDLVGVHGSGRSALLDDVCDLLGEAGWKAVRADGIADLGSRPLGALSAAGLVQRRADSGYGVEGAVSGLVAAAGGGRCALVADDAGDLDETSSGAIVAAQKSAGFPVLSASLPGGPLSVLGHESFASLHPGLALRVPPLSYDDVHAMVVGASGASASMADPTSHVLAMSGGLPAVAKALCDGDDGVGVDRALARMLGGLDAGSVTALHRLSVAGPLDADAAGGLVGWPALEALESRGLVRFAPRGASAVVTVFPPCFEQFFERAGGGAGRLLATRSAVPVLGAVDGPDDHARLVPDLGDDADAVFSRLLREHWYRAARLRRSEWLSTSSPGTAAPLLRAMLVTGQPFDEMADVHDRTLPVGTGYDRAVLAIWFALCLVLAGDGFERALSELERGRQGVGEWSPLLTAAAAGLTAVADHVVDPESLPTVDAASHPREAVVFTEAVRALLLTLRGRSQEALGAFERIEPESTGPTGVGSAAHGVALYLELRLDEALAWAGGWMAGARADHDVDGVCGAAHVAALVHRSRGRADEMRRSLNAGLSPGLLATTQRAGQRALLSMASGVALDAGSTAAARAMGERAGLLRTRSNPVEFGSATRTLAYLEASGRGKDAMSELAATRLWAESQDLSARGYAFTGHLVGAASVLERAEPARVAVLRKAAEACGAPLVVATQSGLDALATGDARTVAAAAGPAAERGLTALAAELYGKASDLASSASERREVQATAAGLTDVAAVTSAGSRTGLTARESDVARMAASGLPNREIATRLFVSLRTVENHLHRVYRKLGVVGRDQLADRLD